MKRAPLSAPALRMLRQIADGGRNVTAADLFDTSKPNAWNTLHALASRNLVQVQNSVITITKQGRSALRAPAPKQTTKKPAKAAAKPASKSAATGAPKRAARSTVRFK